MIERNKEVVLRFLEATGRNDAETVEACVDPDGVSVAKGTSRFTGPRRFGTNIAETIEAFKKIIPTGLRYRISSVTAEGDRVVVQAEGDAVTHDGKPYCNEYCFVSTVKNGKVVRVDEYFCTKMADEVLWPSYEAVGGPAADAS
jgi:ketosteroid isomerase-like protein